MFHWDERPAERIEMGACRGMAVLSHFGLGVRLEYENALKRVEKCNAECSAADDAMYVWLSLISLDRREASERRLRAHIAKRRSPDWSASILYWLAAKASTEKPSERAQAADDARRASSRDASQ